jgi:cyclomaltodextrinase / maltogenic alpha-amylase / neopullulanase
MAFPFLPCFLIGLTVCSLVPPVNAQALPNPARPNAKIEPCSTDPLNKTGSGRYLFLRGTFNQWTAPNEHRFTWICNRYELVTQVQGEHKFKLGDESWSADADFGLTPNNANSNPLLTPLDLIRIGKEINLSVKANNRTTFRFVMRPHTTGLPTLNTTNNPTPEPSGQLTVQECKPPSAPLGDTTLFIRGTMNNWAALDDYALQYSCDAYYINVKLEGPHNFKIADAAWAMPTTFGAGPGGRSTPAHDHPLELSTQSKPGGAADLNFNFSGEMTIRIDFDIGGPRITVGSLSFADPKTASVTDPVALSVIHDSRGGDKLPFGAVTSGTNVQFGFQSNPGITKATLMIDRRRLEGNQEVLEYSPVIKVPMQLQTTSDSNGKQRWAANFTFDPIAIYGYWFELEINGQLYAYQNNTDTVYWTREKGSGGKGSIEPHINDTQGYKRIRRFRLTNYAANFVVPDWAQDAVYYYIFPDRFRNGNPANDPRPGTHRYQNKDVEFHRNWNDKPYKPGTGDGSDAVYNNDFFGGDLEGIIEKLDYIQSLGANVIYMTPIFKAASNHKYDTADYDQIDPAFGSNADFVRLTEQASKRGIRVMVDASLNHTGADSKYFDRFGNFTRGGKSDGAFANGKINPNSPYADWYVFDPKQTETDKQFKGWVGVTDLPELNKNSPAYRRFAFGDENSVTRSWLKRGATGWRMDVAPWVPDEFWREWRKVVKATDPNAMTVAETWFESGKYFLGDTFDSTMNYVFRGVVLDYAMGGDAKKLYGQMELMREMYPKQAFYALMNLISSHDQARALHQFGWKTEGDKPVDEKTITLAKQRLSFATLFQMLYPGSPAIYYGDEVGVTGGDDPFNRGTYPWPDLGGKPDQQLLAEFKRWTKLRADHPILRRGSLGAPLHADQHVIALARTLNSDTVITATNNAATAKTIRMQLPSTLTNQAELTDVISGARFKVISGFIDLTIGPMTGVFLKAN